MNEINSTNRTKGFLNRRIYNKDQNKLKQEAKEACMDVTELETTNCKAYLQQLMLNIQQFLQLLYNIIINMLRWHVVINTTSLLFYTNISQSTILVEKKL